MTTELREWINGVEVVSHLYHAHAARCVEAWWHVVEASHRERDAVNPAGFARDAEDVDA
jgi:hypothetical protein